MKLLRGQSSLKEMAEAIGIKYSAWARYESGDVLPGSEIITKICRIHAVSADWLLGLDERTAKISTGAGSAIAIGGNATVTNGVPPAPGESACCRKCPYRKKLEKLEKLLSK